MTSWVWSHVQRPLVVASRVPSASKAGYGKAGLGFERLRCGQVKPGPGVFPCVFSLFSCCGARERNSTTVAASLCGSNRVEKMVPPRSSEEVEAAFCTRCLHVITGPPLPSAASSSTGFPGPSRTFIPLAVPGEQRRGG